MSSTIFSNNYNKVFFDVYDRNVSSVSKSFSKQIHRIISTVRKDYTAKKEKNFIYYDAPTNTIYTTQSDLCERIYESMRSLEFFPSVYVRKETKHEFCCADFVLFYVSILDPIPKEYIDGEILTHNLNYVSPSTLIVSSFIRMILSNKRGISNLAYKLFKETGVDLLMEDNIQAKFFQSLVTPIHSWGYSIPEKDKTTTGEIKILFENEAGMPVDGIEEEDYNLEGIEDSEAKKESSFLESSLYTPGMRMKEWIFAARLPCVDKNMNVVYVKNLETIRHVIENFSSKKEEILHMKYMNHIFMDVFLKTLVVTYTSNMFENTIVFIEHKTPSLVFAMDEFYQCDAALVLLYYILFFPIKLSGRICKEIDIINDYWMNNRRTHVF